MFNVQQQVRQNQEELQDFLRDLNTWEQKIKVKDQQLSQNKEASADSKVYLSSLDSIYSILIVLGRQST